MATRNTPARRIPGDPLGGMLRNTARMARRSRRGLPVAEDLEPATGPATPVAPVLPDPATPAAYAVARLVTGETGSVVWSPEGLDPVALITATATGVAPVIVTVQQDPDGSATLYAWTVAGEPAPATTLVAAAFPPVAGQPDPVAAT